MAASGVMPKDILKTTTPEGALGWLSKYCRNNPLEFLAGAARATVMAIGDKAAGAKPSN
jgi:hypothetical protein